MAEIVKFRYRSRKAKEREEAVVRMVADHPELGERAAVQLRRVFLTGSYIFVGLTRYQIGLVNLLAARQNVLLPF